MTRDKRESGFGEAGSVTDQLALYACFVIRLESGLLLAHRAVLQIGGAATQPGVVYRIAFVGDLGIRFCV